MVQKMRYDHQVENLINKSTIHFCDRKGIIFIHVIRKIGKVYTALKINNIHA